MSKDLLEYLVEKQFITSEQLAFVDVTLKPIGKSHVHDLIAKKQIDEMALAKFLGNAFELPLVRVTSVDNNVVTAVPFDLLKQAYCLPYKIENEKTLVALADPTQIDGISSISEYLKSPVQPVLVTFSNLDIAFNKISEVLGQATASNPPLQPLAPPSMPARMDTSTGVRPENIQNKSVFSSPPNGSSVEQSISMNAGSAVRAFQSSTVSGIQHKSNLNYPVKKFSVRDAPPQILDEIISSSIARSASDIHIESTAQHVRVRLRIEGTLFDFFQVPIELRDQLVSKLKISAGLDISERRIPQDGRFKVKVGRSDYVIRVNIMPAINGEVVALRVMRPEGIKLTLRDMGFSKEQYAAVENGIRSPSGMVLVTGPTGCGKTSTLYSTLGELNLSTDKVTTVEDPVEYNIEGVVQVQVSNDSGLTFPTILKAILRQDPDVILIGEIRDQETAKIAVQAALSGHLVLSTIHTNDAPSAILRLLNMGMEPFMVVTSLTTVLAQRLVKKICLSCKRSTAYSESQLSFFGEDRDLLGQNKFFKGTGCNECMGTGYKGRTPIFEVLPLTDPLKELVLKGENPVTFRRKIIEMGMTTLRQSGLQLVASGITTLEEAVSSTVET